MASHAKQMSQPMQSLELWHVFFSTEMTGCWGANTHQPRGQLATGPERLHFYSDAQVLGRLLSRLREFKKKRSSLSSPSNPATDGC